MSEGQRETTPVTALIISEYDPDAEKEQKDPFPEIFQKDVDKYERLMEALAHIRKETLVAYNANKVQKRKLSKHLIQAKRFIGEYRKELQPLSLSIKEKRARKEETKNSMPQKDKETKDSMLHKEEETKDSMPQKEEETKDSMPQKEEETKDSMLHKEETNDSMLHKQETNDSMLHKDVL